MAERDPFGRETGEDPLAAMGWADAPATAAETLQQSEASQAAATTASGDAFGQPAAPRAKQPAVVSAPKVTAQRDQWVPVSPPRVRTFSLGWLPKLLFFGAVLVVVGAIAVPLVGTVDDVFDEIDKTVDSIETPAPVAPENAEPPRGLQRRSMLLRGNLAPALTKLRGEMGGGLRYVRIEAERVDVQVTRGKTLVSAQARWDREPQVFPPVTAAVGGETFAWAAVDASAPRRFVRTATRRAGTTSGQFNYAVLSSAVALEWQVFLRDGTHFTASPDGRRVATR